MGGEIDEEEKKKKEENHSKLKNNLQILSMRMLLPETKTFPMNNDSPNDKNHQHLVLKMREPTHINTNISQQHALFFPSPLFYSFTDDYIVF